MNPCNPNRTWVTKNGLDMFEDVSNIPNHHIFQPQSTFIFEITDKLPTDFGSLCWFHDPSIKKLSIIDQFSGLLCLAEWTKGTKIFGGWKGLIGLIVNGQHKSLGRPIVNPFSNFLNKKITHLGGESTRH